jgi:hypothetical protein
MGMSAVSQQINDWLDYSPSWGLLPPAHFYGAAVHAAVSCHNTCLLLNYLWATSLLNVNLC